MAFKKGNDCLHELNCSITNGKIQRSWLDALNPQPRIRLPLVAEHKNAYADIGHVWSIYHVTSRDALSVLSLIITSSCHEKSQLLHRNSHQIPPNTTVAKMDLFMQIFLPYQALVVPIDHIINAPPAKLEEGITKWKETTLFELNFIGIVVRTLRATTDLATL